MAADIIVVIAVLAVDRITKELAARLPAVGMEIIPGILGLRYTENRGIAFSMLSGQTWLIAAVSAAAIAAMAVWLIRGDLTGLPRFGLLLMLGGAAGNLADRLFRGFVPDMIEVLFTNFAVFNAADACLTVGCVLLAAGILFPADRQGKDGKGGGRNERNG